MFPTPVTLRDGRIVSIRPIAPEDAPRLQAGFAHLSPLTIYLRFSSARTGLSDTEAQTLTTVDGHYRMALVGEWHDPETDIVWVVGVARYGVVDLAKPGVAEVAIIVGDPFQRCGLGWQLMYHLSRYARTQGIHTWIADVSPENPVMLRLIERTSLTTSKHFEDGRWVIRMELADPLN